jgi:hypothetical protein
MRVKVICWNDKKKLRGDKKYQHKARAAKRPAPKPRSDDADLNATDGNVALKDDDFDLPKKTQNNFSDCDFCQ